MILLFHPVFRCTRPVTVLGTRQGIWTVGFTPLSHLLEEGLLEVKVIVEMFRRAKLLFIEISQNDTHFLRQLSRYGGKHLGVTA